MKLASAGYQATLAAGGFLLADLYRVVLADSTVLLYTTFDRNINYSGHTYLSTPPGLLERSDISQKRGVQPSELTLIIDYDNTTIDAGLNVGQSIIAQRWRGAIVTLYRALNPLILPNGSAQVSEAVTFFLGRVTQIKVTRAQANITVQSPSELFNQEVPWRLFSPQCRWTLFDVGCGLNKANYAVNGTVQAGSTAGSINATGLLINAASPVNPGQAPQTGYFDTGVLRWTSGKNIGLSATVKSFLGDGLLNSYDNLVLADQPLVYYKLDGALDTSSVLHDYSGNGHDGVNHGISFTGSGGPLAGGSGYSTFDGTDDWGSLSAVPQPRVQAGYLGGVSFECFFEISIAGQPNGLFNSGTVGTGNSQFPGALACASGNSSFTAPLWKWGTFHPQAGFTPAMNQWVHMVAIFRGARYIDVYLNGYLVVTTEDRGAQLGADNYVWTSPTLGKAVPVTGTTLWFAGNLGRWAIYNFAMSPSRILAHYNASQVNAVSQTYQQIQLVIPAPNVPQVGDAFTVYPGCSKDLWTYVNTFGNVGSAYPGNAFLRHGGVSNVPPSDSSL